MINLEQIRSLRDTSKKQEKISYLVDCLGYTEEEAEKIELTPEQKKECQEFNN